MSEATPIRRVAAVIGAPIAHSLSPALHNAAFAAAAVDAVFVSLQVEPVDLPAAVAGMRALGFLGASVTVPHKQAVAGLCDRVEAPADRIGAVNCLAFPDTGEIVGHNTDAGGFVDSLRDGLGLDARGCRAVVLGAGGAARAVHAGLERAGAGSIAVVARSPERAAWAGGAVRSWTAPELERAFAACDLLVDCTPVGLAEGREASLPAPIPLAGLAGSAVVVSLIYHRQPRLLTDAGAQGLRTLDGAGMLVHQGARAFEIWTGRPAPIATMREALHLAESGRK